MSAGYLYLATVVSLQVWYFCTISVDVIKICRFYGLVNTIKVILTRSVNLSTLPGEAFCLSLTFCSFYLG